MLSYFTTYSQAILNVKFNKVKQIGASQKNAKPFLDTANTNKLLSLIDSLKNNNKL